MEEEDGSRRANAAHVIDLTVEVCPEGHPLTGTEAVCPTCFALVTTQRPFWSANPASDRSGG